MITNAQVLDEKFVPRDIAHRDGELNTLTSTLKPITRGESTDPALLFGPPGTGKTCIARYALDQLREEIIDIATQYVNCWQHSSRFTTYLRLLEGINRATDIHRQSTPTDELYDRLATYDENPLVVTLDEVDQLADKSVIYELYELPDISLILIANRDVELFADLDQRITSRLQTGARIRFQPYSVDELVTILKDRVEWGLRDDAVTHDQLEMIANLAAGDARLAIAILRVAARDAKKKGYDQLSDALIDEAVPKAQTEIDQQNLDRLSSDQRLLFDIISEYGEIRPGDLYAEYRERADDPVSDRMVRKHLTKLREYELIVAEGENRGRSYRVVA